MDEILGLIRHALTLVGGYVIAKGYTDDATVTTIIGSAVALIGAVWSVVEKRARA